MKSWVVSWDTLYLLQTQKVNKNLEKRVKQSAKKVYEKGDPNSYKIGRYKCLCKFIIIRKIWCQRAFLEVKFTYTRRGSFLKYFMTKSQTTYAFNVFYTPNFSFTLRCQVIICNFKLWYIFFSQKLCAEITF